MSVVIPVFNGERFIERAMTSALNQTVRDIELIVVNDGSTDGTEAIVREFPDPRVRLVNQENKGLSATRNAGLRACRGEFVAFLDADDVWRSTKLEKQLQIAREGVVIYTDVEYRREGSEEKMGNYSRYDRFPRDVSKFSGDILTTLLSQNVVHPSCILMTVSDAQQVGQFDEQLAVCEDWDFNLRCAERFDHVRIEEPLTIIYRRDDSLQADEDRMRRVGALVLGNAEQRLKDRRALDAETTAALAYGYFTSRNMRLAFSRFLRALGQRPWRLSFWKGALLAAVWRPLHSTGKLGGRT